MAHVLYYTAGTCSLAPNIALRDAGLDFTMSRVDLRAKKLATGEDYLAVNPKGYVPALRLPDGSVLTEASVMLQYIAEQRPEARLAVTSGMERFRYLEWLNFIATELHKGMSPLYNVLAGDDYKSQLKTRLGKRWVVLAEGLRDGYLMGHYTVADAYAFYVMRAWQHAHKQTLDAWPALVDYYARLAARPAVQAALESEGLKP
jgi:glutathione S-transferase